MPIASLTGVICLSDMSAQNALIYRLGEKYAVLDSQYELAGSLRSDYLDALQKE